MTHPTYHVGVEALRRHARNLHVWAEAILPVHLSERGTTEGIVESAEGIRGEVESCSAAPDEIREEIDRLIENAKALEKSDGRCRGGDLRLMLQLTLYVL